MEQDRTRKMGFGEMAFCTQERAGLASALTVVGGRVPFKPRLYSAWIVSLVQPLFPRAAGGSTSLPYFGSHLDPNPRSLSNSSADYPQITWLASIANRVTGSALSGVLYAGAITYLFHPYFPALDSAHLVQLVHDAPTWLTGSAKLLFAVPFTFHTFNGIRHLAWDVGYGESRFAPFAGTVGAGRRCVEACFAPPHCQLN